MTEQSFRIQRWPGWWYCSDNFKHTTYTGLQRKLQPHCWMDQECKTEALILKAMSTHKKVTWKPLFWMKLSPNDPGKCHTCQTTIKHTTHCNPKTEQHVATLLEHPGNRSEDVITHKLPAEASMHCSQLCWRNAAKVQDRRCNSRVVLLYTFMCFSLLLIQSHFTIFVSLEINEKSSHCILKYTFWQV